MALIIDETMDFSLDDYIAQSKGSNNIASSTPLTNKDSKSTNGDVKFGRRKNNIDEEDEDDEDLEIFVKNEDELADVSANDNDTGIWKGPDASTVYLDCSSQQNDLREKLNNNVRNNNISHIQYRLKAPNISADRPRGIPTLLPLDAYVQQSNNNGFNNQNRQQYRNRNRNRNYNNNNNYNNNGYKRNNRNNNFNNNNVNMGNGGVNNGRIQRNRNQDMSKNIRLTVERNGHVDNNYNNAASNKPRNMVIECSSSNINLQPGPQLNSSFQRQQRNTQADFGNRSMPIGNLTPQAQAALDLNSNTQQVSNGSDSLKSLLGFEGNVSSDMMPVFASRLMDFIKTNAQAPVHKPIYDMKIQKDIHEIQKKPFLYKCPGGEVVSSDGAGVNCEVIPRTSGISLNCRFA